MKKKERDSSFKKTEKRLRRYYISKIIKAAQYYPKDGLASKSLSELIEIWESIKEFPGSRITESTEISI